MNIFDSQHGQVVTLLGLTHKGMNSLGHLVNHHMGNILPFSQQLLCQLFYRLDTKLRMLNIFRFIQSVGIKENCCSLSNGDLLNREVPAIHYADGQIRVAWQHAYTLTDEQRAEYESLLDVSGTGIMGYVEIPCIACSLPIYHGTDDAALQIAIGHLEWTSLPTGGANTHCVISGHRGLPSAKLFTDLDRLEEGDVFMLCVLDEVLTYQVDQILIVEPQDTTALQIVPGEDYCTLVTCTPYGINTHRLLVRGHRIENMKEAKATVAVADAIQIEPLIVAPIVAIPMLLMLVIILLLPRQPRKKRGSDADEEE